jgi:hypothetical protein
MATFQQGQLVMRKLGALKHPAAVALLIDCFEAMPNGTSLNILASRRDDPRVVAKLESIAADPSDPSLAKRATTLLAQPSSPPMGASGGPTFVPAGGQFGQPFGQPLPPAPGK